MGKKALPEGATEGFFDVDNIIDAMRLTACTGKSKSVKKPMRHWINVGPSGYQPKSPTVLVDNAKLVPQTVKGVDYFGLRSTKLEYGPVNSVRFLIPRAGNSALADIVNHAIDMALEKYPPESSLQWEKTFPTIITDGTKTYTAFNWSRENKGLATLEVKGEYDSPANTFGRFVTAEEKDDECAWFNEVKFDKDGKYTIYCFDEKGKPLRNVSEDGVVVYPQGGVPSLPRDVARLAGSNLLKDNKWTLRCPLSVTSVYFRAGMNAADEPVVFPVVELSIEGDFVLTKYVREVGENELTVEQADNIIRQELFKGLQMPKKRKVKPAANKESTKKAKAVEEEIEVEDVSDDGEQSD